MIGIINYGMGNLASVQNALNYLNLTNKVIIDPQEVSKCDKLIIPGVGAFGLAMEQLKKLRFIKEIKEFALSKKKPVLGICLGMQLLLDTSTEYGCHNGLGIVPGSVEFLGDKVKNLPIPHMGWNSIKKMNPSILLNNIENEDSFYFVHSYYCNITNKRLVTGMVEYGFDFDCIFESENIFGCQFHPEKSQKIGLTLLSNFGKLLC